MAIYTDSKGAIGSEFVQGGVDATSFARVEPLLAPRLLKKRFLFGIPLVSALPHPVTGRREELVDEDLKDYIIRAVAQMEFESGVFMLPVQMTKKLPFDRQEYLNLGYMQLPDRPILSIESFEIWDADNRPVYKVPTQWIDSGNFQRGQVNLIPLSAGFVGGSAGGAVPSQTAGGAFFLSILGQHGWIPSYWAVTYTTGFREGAIPVIVNELIGTQAAIFVLDELQATNRIAGYSVGLDAASQSVQTAGPQVYAKRIEQLEKQKAILLNKLKARFSLKLFSSNV